MRKRTIPNIRAFVVFCSLMKHGSQTKCAQEFDTTNGNIWYAIKTLEKLVGYELFQTILPHAGQGGNRIVPTTKGFSLYGKVKPAVDCILSEITEV